MDLHPILVSQHLAALEMLRQTIERCPDALWNSPDDRQKFWHVAFHALFYSHLYIQDSPQSLVPWDKHRKGYHRFDQPDQIGEPYSKDDLLEYLELCRRQVADRVPHMDLDARSGFDWLPFSKAELEIYSIRHVQQHTGELMDRLGERAGVEIDWVGNVEH